ncbi:TPA: RHS domain-containing protein [Enterobacter asburiae]
MSWQESFTHDAAGNLTGPLTVASGNRLKHAGVYHYVCDHLGTPLELRDVRGGVVWSAMLCSYGQVHHVSSPLHLIH